MYIVFENYVKPVEVVDQYLEAHRKFLQDNYDKGLFLASGPREPRTGGVILALAGSRWELAAVLEQDPYITEGVAKYEIVEFKATRTGKGLRILLDGECSS
jgi:uncharacterized protein YciI